MSDILCVTNRSLCREDFSCRIEALAAAHPAGIILREKDLSEQTYFQLAQRALHICAARNVPCILHTFVTAAEALGAAAIHLPLPVLRSTARERLTAFSVLGASCHSVEEAQEAEIRGCTYITAGHIYATDCKRGLPGRGLGFLRAVCDAVSIPVYAIGGIGPENIASVRQAGAAGACVMSGAMRCTSPADYLNEFTKARESHGI